ncbi:MAG: hypothetical protein KGH53_02555 [Candidatus Micrarchaeota archaeon]|nr:hypothetical protein [Candidatus Micrarchaeota archaeon]
MQIKQKAQIVSVAVGALVGGAAADFGQHLRDHTVTTEISISFAAICVAATFRREIAAGVKKLLKSASR